MKHGRNLHQSHTQSLVNSYPYAGGCKLEAHGSVWCHCAELVSMLWNVTFSPELQTALSQLRMPRGSKPLITSGKDL